MKSRREFNLVLATAGAAFTVGPYVAFAQNKAIVRMGNASGVIDAQLSFVTVGQSPKVNYYAQEGVDIEIVNTSGSGQALQALAGGNVETGAVAPVAYLGVYAKNPKIDAISAYAWLREPQSCVGVKPDSPIKTLADLKGKKVGIRNQGDSGYTATRVMLQELNINPDTEVEWIAIGEGGPAGDAIYRSRVDAMAYWDAGFMRIELAGFPIRYLANTPAAQSLFGSSYLVRRSTLTQNRAALVGFFRGLAKSSLFACSNVDAAIRLHWQMYPEGKPKGRTDAQAMEEAQAIMNVRIPKWLPQPGQADQRFGAQSLEQWRLQAQFAGVADLVKSPADLFTNDLLDEINAFDRNAVIAQAKAISI